jgi:class 3 adenylate cyclase/tetratricopeptide (TPR) repeat protein
MAEDPSARHRTVDGTLLFVDVSGFTALTERLATRGKVGSEEITDVIGSVFGRLLAIASSYGADLLKWGGDAVLLLFADPGSAPRACRAAIDMTTEMSRASAFRTKAGRVDLAVSIGVHSGAIDLYLLGERHRELVVTGPAATATVRMESLAEAGEVVVSAATADRLDPGTLGAARGEGFVLAQAPRADAAGGPEPVPGRRAEPAALLSADTLVNLQGGGERAEHRQAAVAFLEYSGVDALTDRGGPAAVAEHLDPLISLAEEAAYRYGVNFQETDIGPDGGKIVVVGGIPRVRGNDAERALRAVLDIVSGHPSGSPLRVRAGVNSGRVFAFSHQFEGAGRRVFATTGDAMNLAARVMGKSAPGEVWCTAAVLSRLRNPFETEEVEPFRVKGKSAPVVAHIVRSAGADVPGDAAGDMLPFVGREAELAEILGCARAAASGSGTVLEVAGPAGIGKSRLVAEAISEWNLNTLRIPCEEYGSSTPYLPFRKIFRILTGISPETPGDVAEAELRSLVRELVPELERFMPLLGDVLGIVVPPTREVEELDGRFRRARLERCVVELVKAYLTVPSAVVFEDAQGMDEASASLLEQLGLELAGLPLLVVLTVGAGGGVALSEAVPVVSMTLEPIKEAASADLVKASAHALTPAEIRTVVERARGNPLFLRELVRSAEEAGGVEALPDALEPLLVGAIDQLAPSDRQVLSAAAVLGTRFAPALLAEILDRMPDADVPDDGVLHRLGAFVAPAGGDWRFSHDLVRDAAYEGLSFKRRRELHRRAATAIEAASAVNDPPVELLSLHWMQAERYDYAWDYSRRSADRARALSANRDASLYYERALAAAAHLRLPPDEVFAVAEALGDTSEIAARYGSSRTAYLRARRLCRGPLERARLLRKMGILHERQGRYREALGCYSRGRRFLDEGAVSAAAERCDLSLASAATKERQGKYEDCLHFAEQAEIEAKKAGHLAGLAHALYLQQVVSVYLGQVGDELAHRALRIYEELGDLVGQGDVLNNLGISSYYAGRWGEALDYYERSRVARVRAGDVVGEATAENNIAEILSDQGATDAARPLLESARTTWSSVGFRIGVALATSNLGRLLARSGRVEEGRGLLREALEAFSAMKSPGFVSETQLRLVECDVLSGCFRPAAESLGELLTDIRGRPGFEQTEIAALRLLGVSRAATRRDGGGGEDPLELLRRAAGKAEALGNPYELALCLATASALAGLGLAVTTDERARAEAILSGMGVERAIITWSIDLTGRPLYAFLGNRGPG